MHRDQLPSGARFAFWDDATTYHAVYHVAQGHPRAADTNAGTADAPFLTIAAAASRLQPGQKVVVHEGVYRECVRPARGGQGPDRMIAYEAAPGERVVIRGSELWTPTVCPSSGYQVSGSTGPIWMADLPIAVTADYNPFALRNAYAYLSVYGDTQNGAFMQRALSRRGALFLRGVPLRQVFHYRDLAPAAGAFWVEEPGRRLHFRLPEDSDPKGVTLEATAREQIIAPLDDGLGYLRLSGFICEHAADGLPVPQRAAVSTMRGHHWILEGLRIAWANGCGMDIGQQTWDAAIPDLTGGHIVRGNTIRHCGVCGLAGALGVHHTLIENNLIEEIGGLNMERMWECAGIKFHLAEHTLIRGNTLRHIHHASGIWLDCSHVNTRITDNVFADISCLNGAVYMEMNFDLNCVDHNIFWEIHEAEPACGGDGVRADCNETLMVAHNFFGNIQGCGTNFSLNQSDRRHEGRTGLCRANTALNNVYYRCPHRIALGRREENRCDGNLYDAAGDGCSFQIVHPAPGCHQNLAGWQRYFNLDPHSTQATVTAEFDSASGSLDWRATGPLPETQPVPCLPSAAHSKEPGPRRGRRDESTS
jgi:hypothetical protein